MRKLILLLLVIISAKAFSQTTQQLGGARTKIWIPGQLQIDSLVLMPMRDTNFIPARAGALVFKSGDKFYFYSGTKWEPLYKGATVTETDPTVSAIAKSINASDTTRWAKAYVDSIIKKSGTDSVFYYTLGVSQFAFIDNSSSAASKIDSVKRKSGSDSVFYYTGATKIFAFRDSIGAGETTTGTNLGAGAQVLQGKVGVDYRFRTLLSANSNLVITQNTNDLTLTSKSFIDSVRKKSGTDSVFTYTNGASTFAYVDASTAGGEANTAANVGSGVGLYQSKVGTELRFKSVTTDTTIAATSNANDVELKVDVTRVSTVNRLRDTASAIRSAIPSVNSLYLGNAGPVGAGVFIGVSDSSARFKKLIAGTNVSLTEADSSIAINSSGGASVSGSDQMVQLNVSGVLGSYSNFKYDYPNNRLRLDKIRIGTDHWTNERVLSTNYKEYTYGSGLTAFYDSTYNTHDEKITTYGDNLDLQNFKSTQVIVGYHKLGNTSTFPSDYQHNTFTQVLGGGFLNNATNGAQAVTLATTSPNATTVSNHKFLIQGAGTRTITGWSGNMKLLTEVSSAGTAQNHADLNIGYLYRSGSGAGTGFTFTNKYGLYVNPIKDAGITNAYSIYQEGASDLNYFGGNIYSKRYAQFGPTHWLTNARVVAFVDDTLSGTNPTPNKGIMSDRTITLQDATTLGGNSGNALLVTGYYKADANTTLTSDYQANVFGTYSAGGFLNKSGVATQNITSGTTATNAAVVNMTKLLYQSADSKILTGHIGNYKSAWQIASGGSTENYADMILGIKVRSGSGTSHTVANHRAIHIIPVKDAATTNAYAIYQEGSTDSNYLAGITRMPNLVQRSLDTAAYKLAVVDANGVVSKMYWQIPTGGGGGGGGTWGSITGTLSSQTDLQSALNAKLSASFNTSDSSINITYGGNTMRYDRSKSTVPGLNIEIGRSSLWDGVDTIKTVSAPTFSDITLAGVSLNSTLANKEPAYPAGTTAQYQRGDKTWQTLNTTNVPEGTNQYFTNARARSAVSLTTTGSSGASTYSSATGVLNIPTYTLAGLGGESAITAGTTAQYFRGDKTMQTLNTTAVPEGTNQYFTNARARTSISLTTTGSSGSALYNSTTGVLNIPTYTLAGLGGEAAITAGTTAQYFRGDKTMQTLNTDAVPEGGSQYFTNARARTAVSLTTTGTSGAATYNSTTGVLNIPNYTATAPTDGTYTPSITNTTNVFSSVSNETRYQIVGNVVHVWGQFSVTPTSTGLCEVGFSIPVATGFFAVTDGSGTGASDESSMRIQADVTNDRMKLRWTAPSTSTATFDFHFTYYILPV